MMQTSINTVGFIKSQQFENQYTSSGTIINHLQHLDRVQYQAAHPELRSYTRPRNLGIV